MTAWVRIIYKVSENRLCFPLFVVCRTVYLGDIPMKSAESWLGSLPVLSGNIIRHIAISILVIFLLWLSRLILMRFVMSNTADIRIRYTWQKTTKYLSFIAGAIIIAGVWSQGIHDIATFVAVLSAGIAIALRDILTNFAGWIFIIWVRPLSVGDRIEIGTNRGDVVDTGFFHITLMEIGNWVNSDQSTGRIIYIPNSRIFTVSLANYSKGFQYLWNEIPVLVTFESDWKKAKNILLDIARRHSENISEEAERRLLEASKRFLLFYNKLTPTVYTSVEDSGVMLTIRYLCEPRSRRGSQEIIWEDILNAFAKCDDIDFAYPTQRFYDNIHEGKPLARADYPGRHKG